MFLDRFKLTFLVIVIFYKKKCEGTGRRMLRLCALFPMASADDDSDNDCDDNGYD